jgi:hypothetical protein
MQLQNHILKMFEWHHLVTVLTYFFYSIMVHKIHMACDLHIYIIHRDHLFVFVFKICKKINLHAMVFGFSIGVGGDWDSSISSEILFQ